MRRARWTAILPVAVSLLLPVGAAADAASPAASSPSSPATGPRSNVRELVTFIPPSAATVGFTDWGRIRDSQGASGVTGDSPMADKLRVAMSTSRDEAIGSGFGLAHLQTLHDLWGFDSMDLDWEATIQGTGSAPVFLLRFRDGFDLGTVSTRFDARSFTTEPVAGGTIRTHAMELADWLTGAEFAVLNTGFLDDGRTLVLSRDEAQVLDILANHGSYPDSPPTDATAATLDGASAVVLLQGLGTCVAFTPLPIEPGAPLPSTLPTSVPAGLHPYAVLGIGYDRRDWHPEGRLSFGYLDAATAVADQEPRTAAARDGLSIRVRAPYADSVFQVQDSRVDGASLVLDAMPDHGLPARLFQMVWARDMTFAGC